MKLEYELEYEYEGENEARYQTRSAKDLFQALNSLSCLLHCLPYN